MTNFVNQTIKDLEAIIELFQETANDDLETISDINNLLFQSYSSLGKALNHRIMNEATEEARILAFISNLDRQLQEGKLILTV